MKKVEKNGLDRGGGENINSCHVETGVASLDQGQAESTELTEKGQPGRKTPESAVAEEDKRDLFLKSHAHPAVSQMNSPSWIWIPG